MKASPAEEKPSLPRPQPPILRPQNVVKLLILFAAFACAGGTLVGFAARLGWPWELACHFPAQYCWVLALCAPALLYCGQRRLAMACAALSAVNLTLIVPLYFGPAPPADAKPTVRGLSQNVYWLNPDADPLLELVEAEKPDFI